MIILILVEASQARLTLICVKVPHLSSATTSARHNFLCWELYGLSMILVTDYWHFPVIFFCPLIFSRVTNRVLECVVTRSTCLSLAARFFANWAWRGKLVWGAIQAECAKNTWVLEILIS
jgi:hypothetical protein